jgi:hypothetical protein
METITTAVRWFHAAAMLLLIIVACRALKKDKAK